MKNRNSRIKKALEENGIAQEKLAKRLGISSQAVNERLNKGKEIDSIDFLLAVEDLTGRSFEWLRTGGDQKKMDNQVSEPEPSYNHEMLKMKMELDTLRNENAAYLKAFREIGKGCKDVADRMETSDGSK
jgi:transcriptional regulator with XRE-family HTH domain